MLELLSRVRGSFGERLLIDDDGYAQMSAGDLHIIEWDQELG